MSLQVITSSDIEKCAEIENVPKDSDECDYQVAHILCTFKEKRNESDIHVIYMYRYLIIITCLLFQFL